MAAAVDRADRVVMLGTRYCVQLLHERNARLVADSEAVVAAHDPCHRSGGSLSTMRRAWDQHRPILRVDVRNRRTTFVTRRP